ncbi:MAG: PKD domain-containing protein, partial [Parafilimonas sp.]
MFIFLFCNFACKKTGSAASTNNNHAPLVSIAASLINPFTYQFTATASDADGDKLTYSWDFGDG